MMRLKVSKAYLYEIKAIWFTWKRQAQDFGTLVIVLGLLFNNVLLEHGELPCVLPLAVHLDYGLWKKLRGTCGFYLLPPGPTESYRDKILVIAQRPNSPYWICL